LSTVSTQSHARFGSPIQSLQKVGTKTCQELDAGQTSRENRLYEGEAGPEASGNCDQTQEAQRTQEPQSIVLQEEQKRKGKTTAQRSRADHNNQGETKTHQDTRSCQGGIKKRLD